MTEPSTDRSHTVDTPIEDDPERTAYVRPVPLEAPTSPAAVPAAAPRVPRVPAAPRHGSALLRSEIGTKLAQTVPVATFRGYDSAADAVARIAGTGFPIEHITIVGCDLRVLEEVTGRMTPGRAAGMGAVTGAWFGALVSALVGIFAGSLGAFLGLLLWSIILGAIFGAGLGVLAFFVVDRGRGFTSDREIVAGRYDLYAPAQYTDQLRDVLLTHRPADVSIIDGHPR